MNKPILTTLTGPSGSGKSELLNILCRDHGFERLVSVTTRDPRPGEVDGVEYYFIDKETFRQHEIAGRLIQSVGFNGANYGTTVAELERVVRKGAVPAIIVEPGGVRQFGRIASKIRYDVYSVFVDAPLPQLVERFLRRMVGEKLTEDKVVYNAKRLTSIYTEAREWKDLAEYDMFLHNSGTIGKLSSWAADIADDVARLSKKSQ